MYKISFRTHSIEHVYKMRLAKFLAIMSEFISNGVVVENYNCNLIELAERDRICISGEDELCKMICRDYFRVVFCDWDKIDRVVIEKM